MSRCIVAMLISLAVILASSGLSAAEEWESGVVIYTSIDHGSDENAFAVPFVKAERHKLVVNVTTKDGKTLRVTNNRLKELVRPTDLSRATAVDEAGLHSLRHEAESIRSMQKRYPGAEKILDQIAGEIERTITVIESGNVLVSGRLIPLKEYEKQKAVVREKSIDITMGGKNFTGAKLSSFNGDKVSIMHSGGATSISIEELSDEQIARLIETSNNLVLVRAKEVVATSPKSSLDEPNAPATVIGTPRAEEPTPLQQPGSTEESRKTVSTQIPDPEPAPRPLTPISFADLREFLGGCEPLLQTVREGIVAAA